VISRKGKKDTKDRGGETGAPGDPHPFFIFISTKKRFLQPKKEPRVVATFRKKEKVRGKNQRVNLCSPALFTNAALQKKRRKRAIPSTGGKRKKQRHRRKKAKYRTWPNFQF